MIREPTEMELSVAEAIKSVDDSKSNGGLGASYLSLARAAIRAMRDVVPVVRTSDGYIAHELRGPTDATWRCMIDAASPPEDKP